MCHGIVVNAFTFPLWMAVWCISFFSSLLLPSHCIAGQITVLSFQAISLRLRSMTSIRITFTSTLTESTREAPWHEERRNIGLGECSNYMLTIWSILTDNTCMSYICRAEMRTEPSTCFLASRGVNLYVVRHFCILLLYSKTPFFHLVAVLKRSAAFFLFMKMFFPCVCPALHPDFLNLIKTPSGFLKYCYDKSFLRGTLFLSLAR